MRNYVALWLVIFIGGTVGGAVIVAVAPAIWDALTANPMIVPIAAVMAFVGVLADMLDDLRSARRQP